jgi:hypothetical protein
MTDRTYKKVKNNVYIAKDNFVKKATEFYLAVSVDMNGNEGVVAMIDLNRYPHVEKPLMGVSIEDKEAILKAAENASHEAAVKIRVLKYTRCEVIAEFLPKKLN